KNVILFIDDIHSLFAVKDQYGYRQIFYILNSNLSSGNVKAICTTTFKEYTINISPHKNFEQRLERIQIEEPDETQSLDIVFGIKDSYEKRYNNINFTNNALESSVKL
ncbi:ATP-dependent Clp protease ATP-binding subunit ClpC, partial [Candidatus Magnetomorum sp. HK-1]